MQVCEAYKSWIPTNPTTSREHMVWQLTVCFLNVEVRCFSSLYVVNITKSLFLLSLFPYAKPSDIDIWKSPW